MHEPITKEKFKDLVRFQVSEDGYGDVKIVAGVVFNAKKTIEHHYAVPEVIKDVKECMIEELWHTVYGSRRKAFAEKCTELLRCNPTEFGNYHSDYHKLVNEIIAMSDAL